MNAIIEKCIDMYIEDLHRILAGNYCGLILYGSATLNDYIPGRGDIDFLVITCNDLSQENISDLIALHDKYRESPSDDYRYQLEGTYYPEKIVKDIRQTGVGLYIGTRRKGWKKIDMFNNSIFDLIQFRTNAEVYDYQKENIYEPQKVEIENAIRNEIVLYKNCINDKEFPAHVIVQFVARTLYYLEHNRICSKGRGCELLYNVLNDEYVKKCQTIKMQDDYNEIAEQYPNRFEVAKKALDLLELRMKKAS